jgi:ribosomal protein S7
MSYQNLIGEKTLYKKFLGVLVKKGNLISAKAILDKAFLIVSRKRCLSKEAILLKLFVSLNCFVEVKRIRVRRKSFLVPCPIDVKRRSYLIVRWLMQSVKEDSKKKSLSDKLSNEISNVVGKVPTRSKRLKKLNISQALSNRSNTHFRWKI